MKPKSFIFGFLAVIFTVTLTLTSCTNDGLSEEELQQIEQPDPLSIDKEEIKEEDT